MEGGGRWNWRIYFAILWGGWRNGGARLVSKRLCFSPPAMLYYLLPKGTRMFRQFLFHGELFPCFFSPLLFRTGPIPSWKSQTANSKIYATQFVWNWGVILLELLVSFRRSCFHLENRPVFLGPLSTWVKTLKRIKTLHYTDHRKYRLHENADPKRKYGTQKNTGTRNCLATGS